MILLNKIMIVLLLSFSFFTSFSQEKLPLTNKQIRWQHLDLTSDSVYGISMDRAYKELLKGHKKKTVVVAVIDTGTDTLHTDLQPILWLNKKEKGSDEDHNGYLNDRHGWNFLGSKKGNGPVQAGLERQRIYLSLKRKCANYSDSEILTSGDKECIMWLSTKQKFKTDSAFAISSNLIFSQQMASEDSILRKTLGKEVYNGKNISDFEKESGIIKGAHVASVLLKADSTRTNKQVFYFEERIAYLKKWYSTDPAIHRAETIGDNYNNVNDRFYGNTSISTGAHNHGTQVASVIGALRNNGVGIDGIADAVRLMIVRAVPNGQADEYDKDIALAIRYAADNGAKVINMSFGKQYSPQSLWVEEAIEYALKKDVLIVHAAGNDANNIDSVANYPSGKLPDGQYAPNLITVGASGAIADELIASFSNYGKQSVNIFAPGSKMYVALMNGDSIEYKQTDGTSIAAPIVSGLAAVLRSYFPTLTAIQVKNIIERSVTKIEFPVLMPGKKSKMVAMSELCKAGGIVNAYNAIKLANEMTRKSN